MSLKNILIPLLAGIALLLCGNAWAGYNTSTLVTFTPRHDGGGTYKIKDGAGPSLDPLRIGSYFDPVHWLAVNPLENFVIDNPFNGDPLRRVTLTYGTVELTTNDFFVAEIGTTIPMDTEPQDPVTVLQTLTNNATVSIDGVAIQLDKLPAVYSENTAEECQSGGLEYPCGYDYYYNITMRITKPGTYHVLYTDQAFEPFWGFQCAPDEACIPPILFQEEWTLHVTGADGGDQED